MRKLPNLDFMRALAVLLVLLDHVLYAFDHPHIGPLPARWIGSAGVYLFFVHTCMVLMWSMERHSTALAFYVRRILRIYPLATAVLLATLWLRLPLTPYAHAGFTYPGYSWRAVLANLFLVQNLVDGRNIVGVNWTLPLELQMYLVLPALFALVRKTPRLWVLFSLWCVIAWLNGLTGITSEHATNMCVPCFLPGVMGYLLFSKVRPRLKSWLLPIFLLGAVFIFLLRPEMHTGWLLCLAVGLAIPFFVQMSDSWLTRAAHAIAEYSYSIYLVHLVAIYLGIVVWSHFGLLAGVAAAIISGTTFTVLAHHFIERPGMRVGARLSAFIETRQLSASQSAPQNSSPTPQMAAPGPDFGV